MKDRLCQIVSRERLVAYADGDLSPSEAEQTAEHIAICPDCKVILEALECSLQVTRAIWQTAQAQWSEAHSFDKIASSGLPLKKAVAVAASILLILAVSVTWQLLSEPSERTRTISEEAKVAELRLKIANSSDAARLLAAAELLSRYPGTKSSVEQRYRQIVETYPETAAAMKARLRTQQLK